MLPTPRSVAIIVVCFASVALADDFKTIEGKEYKNATITRAEPDGIVLRTKSGITKVYFVELPKEVQERFHYEPDKALAYSAAQTKAQQQQQKGRRPVTDADLRAAGVSDDVIGDLHTIEADMGRYHRGGSLIYRHGDDGFI